MRISDWSSDVCSSDLLETSLHFFRGARSQYEEAFAALAARGIHRIALVGSGELAEIALLSASSAGVTVVAIIAPERRSEEHTSEVQSLMRISYAVFCLKKKTNPT